MAKEFRTTVDGETEHHASTRSQGTPTTRLLLATNGIQQIDDHTTVFVDVASAVLCADLDQNENSDEDAYMTAHPECVQSEERTFYGCEAPRRVSGVKFDLQIGKLAAEVDRC